MHVPGLYFSLTDLANLSKSANSCILGGLVWGVCLVVGVVIVSVSCVFDYLKLLGKGFVPRISINFLERR